LWSGEEELKGIVKVNVTCGLVKKKEVMGDLFSVGMFQDLVLPYSLRSCPDVVDICEGRNTAL
jgi:hypothetical protein